MKAYTERTKKEKDSFEPQMFPPLPGCYIAIVAWNHNTSKKEK